MNIIETALTSFEEYEADAPGWAAEQFERTQLEFLQSARDSAARILSDDAAKLDWRYIPADELPESVEEARALLAPGRSEYLRYRADYSAETYSFELVRPCNSCGHDRVDPVDGYVTLGRLLAQDGARSS